VGLKGRETRGSGPEREEDKGEWGQREEGGGGPPPRAVEPAPVPHWKSPPTGCADSEGPRRH
jgi:hypothetical protein